GEGHPGNHDRVGARVVVVGDDQPGVEFGPHTVPGEVAHHAVAEAFGVGLDDPADDVDLPARLARLDAAHEGFAGAFHEQPGFFVDVADEEGGVGVAVHPVDVGGDVDVDDVAVLEDGVVGDAVADDFVDGRAQRLGEALVAERAGVGAVVAQELVADPVEFVCGDAGLHVFADCLECVRSDPAGHPHGFDGLRGLHIPSDPFDGMFLTDVFGPGDGRRDRSWGRDTPGYQRGSHGIRV